MRPETLDSIHLALIVLAGGVLGVMLVAPPEAVFDLLERVVSVGLFRLLLWGVGVFLAAVVLLVVVLGVWAFDIFGWWSERRRQRKAARRVAAEIRRTGGDRFDAFEREVRRP